MRQTLRGKNRAHQRNGKELPGNGQRMLTATAVLTCIKKPPCQVARRFVIYPTYRLRVADRRPIGGHWAASVSPAGEPVAR